MGDPISAERSDSDLLASAASGDQEAFAHLVRRHQARVYRLARIVTRSDADAEDVLQQAFLAAYRNAGSYRGDASVRNWLLTITRNAALKLYKQESTRRARSESLMELGRGAGWGQLSPESLAERAQDRRRLASALSSLPPLAREILVLRELEGMSGPDTAQVLGLSLPAMKSRLHRARLQLAKAIRVSQEVRDG